MNRNVLPTHTAFPIFFTHCPHVSVSAAVSIPCQCTPKYFVLSAVVSVVVNQAGHDSPGGRLEFGGVHATAGMRIDLNQSRRDGGRSP